MNWYYADGTKQLGPISQEQFDILVGNGGINAQTLVWREGMAGWQPYGTISGATSGATPLVVCDQCGKAVPADEAIRYGTVNVCAACKPVFVQKLKEGTPLKPAGELEYGTFLQRGVAKILDNLITRAMAMFLGFIAGAALGSATGRARLDGPELAFFFLLGVGLEICYRALFIGATGATPGKMIMKLKVVNADGSRVSYAVAFGRAFAEYLSLFICLIGYFIAGFDEERRTLHDRICSTRVIKN